MKKFKCEQLAEIVLIILVLFPMLVKGIMCNDELLLRLWGQQGMDVFFKNTIVDGAISKGRVLGIIGSVKFLPYISDNKYIFGTINLVMLLSAIILFGYFTYKLWRNRNFSVLLCVLILVFLPMNFEFAAPNAFVIVTCLPMILLEISLIFYLKYLENNKRKDMLICIIMFMWSMFKYEFIITYVLLFPIIYIIKNYNNSLNLKNIIRYNYPIMVAAITYLVLYIGQSMIFPSNYKGTQLAVTSVTSIIRVLNILFFSAFPTYYSYFNAKYKYLFEFYNHGGIRLENVLNPNILIFVIILVFLLFSLLKVDKKMKREGRNWLRHILIVGTALLYAVLPALPNALTPMYQEGVTDESFTSIPVSIFLYFAIMLMITYLLWNILNTISKNWVIIAVVAIITLGAVGNQIRNQVFVNEQVANYDSLVAIEDVLALDYWKQYGSISISAPSLYKTKNSLAIEEGHWSEYAKIYGNKLLLDNVYDAGNVANLVIQDDNSFYLYFDNIELLITKQIKSGSIVLKDVLEEYKIVNISDCIWNEGHYKIYLLNFHSK